MSKKTLRKRIAVVAAPVTPEAPVAKPAVVINSISANEYTDHMQLSLAQLETVTLMLQALDQTADGGQTP